MTLAKLWRLIHHPWTSSRSYPWRDSRMDARYVATRSLDRRRQGNLKSMASMGPRRRR